MHSSLRCPLVLPWNCTQRAAHVLQYSPPRVTEDSRPIACLDTSSQMISRPLFLLRMSLETTAIPKARRSLPTPSPPAYYADNSDDSCSTWSESIGVMSRNTKRGTYFEMHTTSASNKATLSTLLRVVLNTSAQAACRTPARIRSSDRKGDPCPRP